MKDLTVILEDRPGTLADLGEATGRAGINIEGVCGTTQEGQGVIHIVVEDAAATRAALSDAGIDVRGERDVLVGMATFQIAQAGTEQQIAAARDVLVNARRALYGILAENEPQGE
jgi:hypothetical protein